MFFHGKSYKSQVVNTDSNGFRFTTFNGKEFSSDSLTNADEVSIVIGGSTAFGVGATSDSKTISSILGQKTNVLHLNLGGRALNSTQELLLFKWLVSKKPKIKNVTIMSGANDLYLSSISTSSFMPSQFFGKRYEALMLEGMLSPKRKILRKLFARFVPDNISWSNTNIRTVVNSSLKSLFTPSSNGAHALPKNYSKRNICVKKAIESLDSSLCFWSALSTFIGFRLTYVLQPFAGWSPKQYTLEEKALFEYLDAQQGPGEILRQMSDTQRYIELTQSLSRICDNYKINYLDSNIALTGRVEANNEWLYVDRVHLTDLGYQLLADLISHQAHQS